jgi:WD40 repeat protein
MVVPSGVVEIIDNAISLLSNCGWGITLSALHTYGSVISLASKTSITSSYLLWTTSLYTLEGHSSVVTSVMFSPDGRKLALVLCDHTVRLWDVKMGNAIGSALKGHSNLVRSVIFRQMGESWLQHRMTIWCICGMSKQVLP